MILPSKTPRFEFTANSATFRVAHSNPPLEEVSVVGTGRFEGKELTTLYTIQIRPRGTSEDIRDGAGILYMAGSSRATYWMTGSLKSTREWRELVRRTMAFGGDCTGELRELKGVMTSDETLVNSKGKSRTKVWK